MTNKKFTFIDLNDTSFELHFDIPNEDFISRYITETSNNTLVQNLDRCDFYNRHLNIFENKINWGLGYYLGFRNKFSAYNSDDVSFENVLTSTPRTNGSIFGFTGVTDSSSVQVVQSDDPAKLNGDKVIYMEMDPYNYIDEIDPNNANTNNAYNNQTKYNVNSAFSKILLQVNDNNSSSDAFLGKEKRFEPPLPRLSSCKFRFRYHDGRIVNFRNQDFSFSLKIDYMPISRR